MTLEIPYIEMHLTHSCNLACAFCSHYCDIGYKGTTGHAEGVAWLEAWSKRVLPKQFRLLGGEPFLNPELDQYIVSLEKHFPRSKRSVVTNGLLVADFENLMPQFIKTGTRLYFCIHPVTQKQGEKLRESLRVADKWLKKGLLLTVSDSFSGWRRQYQGEGDEIVPYADGNPDKSFMTICEGASKACVNLHHGKLWKCAQLAYLPLVIDKLKHKEKWQPYLEYAPLEPDATDEELARFFRMETAFCDMCPAEIHPIGMEELLKDSMVIIEDTNKKSRKRWRALGKIRAKLGI